MARQIKAWWMPAAAFVVAAMLSIFAGPVMGTLSARLLQEATGGCPCKPCCGSESQAVATPSKQGVGQGRCDDSEDPVRYTDGVNLFQTQELSSGGANGWKHELKHNPKPVDWLPGRVLYNWQVAHMMSVYSLSPGTISVLDGGTAVRTFVDAGLNTYFASPPFKETLTFDPVNLVLVFADTKGSRWEFYHWTHPWNSGATPPYHLKRYTDPAGNTYSFTYGTGTYTSAKLLQVVTSQTVGADVHLETWAYDYYLSGSFAGQLSTVTLSRTKNGVGGPVRKSLYTYYTTGGSNGPAQALQRIQIQDGASAGLEDYYFRYTPKPSGAFGYMPRYVLAKSGYDRAEAALGSFGAIDAALDSTIAQWASNHFQYDSQDRVSLEVVQGKGCGCGSAGGKGTYSYAYFDATHGGMDASNVWRRKTIETLPDGNQNIVYTNKAGGTLLKIFKEVATGNEWKTYYQYDADYRLVLMTEPSCAVTYNELSATLGVSIPASTGLVHTWEYYLTTDLPNGAVAGFLKQEGCRNGQLGALVPKRLLKYTSRTSGTGITVYPVSSETVYRNDNGTGAIVTSYSYTWHGTTTRMASRTTTFPIVTTAQNGSNVATTRIESFDTYGRLISITDENGFVHTRAYDPATGALAQTVVNSGGLNLTTAYRVDAMGRPTKITDPNGNVTYVVHRDPQHETRVYPGWTGTTTTGPTRVMREDHGRSYHETLTMSATPALNGSEPAGTEAISAIQSLSREHLDTGDRPIHIDSYFSFSGLSYTQSTSMGTQGTHFYRKTINYDIKGRSDRDLDWTGTVRRLVYDARDRVKSAWIGTDDVPTSGDWSPTNTAGTNLIKTGENEYDANGIGDGNLTKSKFFTAAATSLDTNYKYDWRNRLTDERGPQNVATKRTYDNLNQVTVTETYASADFTYTAGELRAKSETKFDEKGQEYQTIVHHVNPTTGAIGNRLTTNTWSNARGWVVKVRGPNGEFQKTAYDGAGRVTASFVSYHDAESAYADADDVVGDTVVSQAIFTYDASGNRIQTTSYERTSSSVKTGDLSSSWAETDSRRTYTAFWYDLANRPTSTVDYGRNGGTALSRPSTPPAPNTSDAYIVTKTDYDAAGRAYRTTDNKNRITERTFDLLGRSTKVIENRVDGLVGNAEYDTDRTTEQIYDSVGRLSQLKARNPKGASVEDQITTYVYGTDANVASPAVYRNDVLVGEIYPDSDDTYNPGGAAGAKFGNGTDATYDRVEYTYDYASRKKTWKLQLTTLHTYVYDSVGRLSQDQVTTLGSGIEGSIRRIVYTYDDLSRKATVSSYSTATGGTLLNQVAFSYDGWGNELSCAQGHEGTATGAPTFTKTFADGAVSGEAKFVRLASMTYPNGRIVHHNYPGAGTAGDKLSRVDNVANDASGTLKFAQYTYLGAGAIVKIAHPQVTGGLNLDYGTGTGNPAGWDDLGRIDEQKWQSDAAVVKDQYQYGYDRTSNRTFRDNLTATAKDEFFAMDGLDRVTTDKRGDLNAGRTDITGTPAFQETWSLEGTGNWRQLIQTTAGTTTLNQTRTHTKANETTTIAATVGTNWGDGVLDRNGNMTRVPKVSSSLNQRWRLTYDAWGRLMRVVNDSGGATIAEYKYDGLHRRTVKLKFLTSTTWDRRDYYYSCDWQVVEERELLNQTSKTVVATAPKFQNVWDVRYIDAIVLRDENKDGDGDCVDGTDQRLYYCQDANFNVTALVDTAGTVVERVQYDAYGKHALFQANWTTTQASTVYNNEVLYAGYRHNPESGMYQVRHREYHPGLGRWTQRDPLAYEDGTSLYQYVGSSPAMYRDPFGLLTLVNDHQEHCQALLETMANIARNIERREKDLARNEGPKSGPNAGIPLPERPPYPGAPLRDSKDGHRELIAKDRENLRKLQEDYDNNCIDKKTGKPKYPPQPFREPKTGTNPGTNTSPMVAEPVKPMTPEPEPERRWSPSNGWRYGPSSPEEIEAYCEMGEFYMQLAWYYTLGRFFKSLPKAPPVPIPAFPR